MKSAIRKLAVNCILPAALLQGPMILDILANEAPSAVTKINAGQPVRKPSVPRTIAPAATNAQSAAAKATTPKSAAPATNQPQPGTTPNAAPRTDQNAGAIVPVANPAPVQRGPNGESDVQRQLRALYQKSGQEMPAMTLDELEVPEPQSGVQPDGEDSGATPQQVGQPAAPPKAPNLFERIFLGKKAPPPTAPPRPLPQRPQTNANGYGKYGPQNGATNQATPATQQPNYRPYQNNSAGQQPGNPQAQQVPVGQPLPQGYGGGYGNQTGAPAQRPTGQFGAAGQNAPMTRPSVIPAPVPAMIQPPARNAEPKPLPGNPSPGPALRPMTPPAVQQPAANPKPSDVPVLDELPTLDQDTELEEDLDLTPKAKVAPPADAPKEGLLDSDELVVPETVTEPEESLESPFESMKEPEPNTTEAGNDAESPTFDSSELPIIQPDERATDNRSTNRSTNNVDSSDTSTNESSAKQSTTDESATDDAAADDENPFSGLKLSVPEPVAVEKSPARSPITGNSPAANAIRVPKAAVEADPFLEEPTDETAEPEPFLQALPASPPVLKAPAALPEIPAQPAAAAKPSAAKVPQATSKLTPKTTPKPIAVDANPFEEVATKSEAAPPVGERRKQLAAAAEKSGLKGFCPVALRQKRQLVAAKTQFSATHRGQQYHFASAEAKSTFEKSPDLFAPAHGGNDAIALLDDERSVPGTLDFSAWFQGRLYLFASRQNLETFNTDPEGYLDEPEDDELTITSQSITVSPNKSSPPALHNQGGAVAPPQAKSGESKNTESKNTESKNTESKNTAARGSVDRGTGARGTGDRGPGSRAPARLPVIPTAVAQPPALIAPAPAATRQPTPIVRPRSADDLPMLPLNLDDLQPIAPPPEFDLQPETPPAAQPQPAKTPTAKPQANTPAKTPAKAPIGQAPEKTAEVRTVVVKPQLVNATQNGRGGRQSKSNSISVMPKVIGTQVPRLDAVSPAKSSANASTAVNLLTDENAAPSGAPRLISPDLQSIQSTPIDDRN